MTSWAEFEADVPELAAAGRRLLRWNERDGGLLATVRGNEPPRIHPVTLGVVEGRLLVFVLKSAKRTDLERDGRYALHAHQDPAAPSEFLVRGRARRVTDDALRAAAASAWAFEVDDTYQLFELSLETAVLGRRDDADAWPPVYTTWRSPG
jgi:hypothetical protein